MNFSKYSARINAKQVLARAGGHPEFVKESHITQGEMFDIKASDTKYHERDKNLCDVNSVNLNLANARIAAQRTQDEESNIS